MEHFFTALNVVLPVFLMILLGYGLRQKAIIDEKYIQISMKVVFNVCLPGMLFSKVSKSDVSLLFSKDTGLFALYVVLATLGVFTIAKIVVKFMNLPNDSHGTFIQGVFRSNYIIIGYSVIYSLFGDTLVTKMAVLVVTIVPLYNILAIWVLTGTKEKHLLTSLKMTALKVVKNPLIIGIALGFIAALAQIKLPVFLDQTISQIGAIGTPLGLLGIGAYFTLDRLSDLKSGVLAALLKVIVFPALVTGIGYLLGFQYMDLAIIFVLFGSPTAISSFIMATALDGDATLAANIVIISTAASLITMVAGLSVLGSMFL